MDHITFVKITAISTLIISAWAAKLYIPRIRVAQSRDPLVKLREGVIAGGLIGAFMSAGIVVTNSSTAHAVADPNFLRNQMMVAGVFTGIGMFFGSIRVLNK